MKPLASIRITDPAPILRAANDAPGTVEMVTRRWSWPAPSGKPVYNYRSDGRAFGNGADHGRCLIPIDGFYEFTDGDVVAEAGPAAGHVPSEHVATADLFGNAPPLPERPGAGGRRRPLPPDGSAPRRRKTPAKAKWQFRMIGLDWFCVAGLWRTDPQVGEAWTMLTCPPGPDIAPYHDRQIVLLGPADYGRWLDGSAPTAELCRPLPAGTLSVERVR
jgi:putative SOS response-associated peptidase YedK